VSGIVGILNQDGAPVDPALLARMTRFMTFRGPDAQQVWVDGNVGFGHTLLRTTEESREKHQPFTLDGLVWIVADARVDARSDLMAKLAACREHVQSGMTDVELLLRSYRAWGTDCVERLLGDFTFAIWDRPRRRLFCARDHLGVRPFFYAHLGQTVVFSNTLDCIREHPMVSDKLNDSAIADFLLFDLNQEPTTTSFADIHRIPPAHRATWSADGSAMTRYWTLPIDEPTFFRQADDYTDRFKELLEQAVSDRLRTNKIAIFMSGGLDSPTLAATALRILRSRSSDGQVRAFTTLIDGLDQNERYYAGVVAERLGIPIHFRDRSPKTIDPRWNRTAVHTPEPVSDPRNLAGDREQYGTVAAHSRVLFYGEGPDNALLYEWRPYLSYLVRTGKFGRLAADISGHMISHRRIPLLTTIPRSLKNWAKQPEHISFPRWFNETFETRTRLRERWENREKPPPLSPSHPIRPVAYRSFQTPLWEALFRCMDPDQTGAPLETRHPFLDLRMLRYLLSVPALPWCRAKYLERRAMRDALPAAVLRRQKSPLTGDPSWEAARSLGLPPMYPHPTLAEYVNFDRVPKDVGSNVVLFRLNFRPLALKFWLHNLRRKTLRISKEELDNELVRKSAW